MLYVASTSLTSFSGIFFLRNYQHTSSLGTLSYAYCNSAKQKDRFFFTSKNFSCNCLTIDIASVVPRLGRNKNLFAYCGSKRYLIAFVSKTLSYTFMIFIQQLFPSFAPTFHWVLFLLVYWNNWNCNAFSQSSGMASSSYTLLMIL